MSSLLTTTSGKLDGVGHVGNVDDTLTVRELVRRIHVNDRGGGVGIIEAGRFAASRLIRIARPGARRIYP
jgi:hypothetical protein